eukprot:764652-Hanusia_phi.AAC.1
MQRSLIFWQAREAAGIGDDSNCLRQQREKNRKRQRYSTRVSKSSDRLVTDSASDRTHGTSDAGPARAVRHRDSGAGPARLQGQEKNIFS